MTTRAPNATVQGWRTFGTVYLRPSYEQAEELLVRLRDVLAPLPEDA